MRALVQPIVSACGCCTARRVLPSTSSAILQTCRGYVKPSQPTRAHAQTAIDVSPVAPNPATGRIDAHPQFLNHANRERAIEEALKQWRGQPERFHFHSLVPGDWVESRAPSGSAFLVYLKPSKRRGKGIFLAVTGRILLGSIENVVHVLPGTVSAEDAIIIGGPILEPDAYSRGPVGVENGSEQLHDALDVVPEDTATLVLRSTDMDARRKAIHQSRETALLQESLAATIRKSDMIQDLYKNKAKDSDWAQITLRDALNYFVVERALPGEADQLELAVKRALLDDEDHFVADRDNLLQTNVFHVRPKQDLEDLHVMRGWLHDGLPPHVVSFLAAMGEAANHRHEDERRLVRLLVAALASGATIQSNPYTDLVGTILKQAGYVTAADDAPLSDVVSNLLRRTKTFRPWSNLVARDPLSPLAVWSLARHRDAHRELATADPLDEHRRDFDDLPVYAIDGPTALEIDDAIAVEPAQDGSTWVHVHIADPTSAIPREHFVVDFAAKRGASIYGLEQHWPMLDAYYIEKAKVNLGDGDGERQRTMVFSARVDAEGEVVEERVQAGWARRLVRTTYASVDGREEATERPLDPLPATAEDDLRRMREVAGTLYRRRLRDALLIGSYPQTNVSYSPGSSQASGPRVNLRGGASRSEAKDVAPPSTDMVAECMILANRLAARFCHRHQLPVLYRSIPLPVSDTPDALARAHLATLRDPVTGLIPWRRFLDSDVQLGTPVLSASPGPHIGIGVDSGGGYLQVTSPLRRFTDLLAHYQLRSHLLGSAEPFFSPAEVADLARRYNAASRGRRRFEKRLTAHWALYALRERVAAREVTTAIVTVEGAWRGREAAVVATVVLPGCGGVRATLRAPGGVGEDVEALCRKLDRGKEVECRLERAVLDMSPTLYVSLVH